MPDLKEIYQEDLTPLFDDFWFDVRKLVKEDTTGTPAGLDEPVKSRVEGLVEALIKVAKDRGVE
jgi:hypothetical protein